MATNLSDGELMKNFAVGVGDDQKSSRTSTKGETGIILTSNMKAATNTMPSKVPDVSSTTTARSEDMKKSKTVVMEERKDGRFVMRCSEKRRFLIVGCGNGGCNIAATIREMYPDDTKLVMYNTSKKGLSKNFNLSERNIVSENSDGSGKDRELSKSIFKAGSYKKVISEIRDVVKEDGNFDYIAVVTTCDGGTGGGISPAMSKFIADNIGVPVIIIGVLPNTTEDAVAQYNAIAWYQEVSKNNVPYILFDNKGVQKYEHTIINKRIAELFGILIGTYFGDSEMSQIDNQDMATILMGGGGRIALYMSDVIDAPMSEIVDNCYQPGVDRCYMAGVFLKGPSEMLRFDASKYYQYFGALSEFNHIEESNRTKLCLILSGCGEPQERLIEMKAQYERIMSASAQADEESVVSHFDMVNPIRRAAVTSKAYESDGDDIDMSALDF